MNLPNITSLPVLIGDLVEQATRSGARVHITRHSETITMTINGDGKPRCDGCGAVVSVHDTSCHQCGRK